MPFQYARHTCNLVRELYSFALDFGVGLIGRKFGGRESANATLQVRSRRLLTDLSCLRDSLAASIFRRYVTARATVLTEEISTG